MKQDHINTINKSPLSILFCIKINIKKKDKNDMVSQMAHAKNLGEPFMAHLENLYNIPWVLVKIPENFMLQLTLILYNTAGSIYLR